MRATARMFKALSDETRLQIMGLVQAHGRLCVCEVQEVLGISQSKASRHLRYLRDAGLLADARDGAVVNYTLPDHARNEVRLVLDLLPSLVPREALPPAGPILVELRLARSGG